LRTVEDVILDWKGEFGVLGRSANGPYRYIDYKQKKDLLMILVQTLLDEGYDSDTIQSMSVVNAIVNGCEAPDGASSRTSKAIKKGKQITTSQLKEFVFKEFFRGSVSKHVPEPQNTVPEQTIIELPKKEESKEDLLEKIMNPKNRIKVDANECVDTPPDLAFLAELGITSPLEDE
jgi:hypothetical protein